MIVTGAHIFLIIWIFELFLKTRKNVISYIIDGGEPWIGNNGSKVHFENFV